MKIELIEISSNDTDDLLQMQKICFEPHLQRYQDHETSPATMSLNKLLWQVENENFFKVFADDVWVGAVNIRKLDGFGAYKLHMIYILPEHQNKGIGQEVIKLAEDKFLDARTWSLETLEDMQMNRHVYEKMGYHFTGKKERVNENLTLIFYQKEIV